MKKHQIQITSDGSHTIKSEQFGALYHSAHGSFQEAIHIFINNGIASSNLKELAIFEMGFGSGLNAIANYFYAKNNEIKVNYVCIEAYPISLSIAEQLNYNTFFNESEFETVFRQMHTLPWNEKYQISPLFSFLKISQKIEDYLLESHFPNTFDMIYYDAFSPNDQQNLWEKAIFEKMYKSLKAGGFLITYCAQGHVKRTLKSLNFVVQALPGPIGKREITKAVK